LLTDQETHKPRQKHDLIQQRLGSHDATRVTTENNNKSQSFRQ